MKKNIYQQSTIRICLVILLTIVSVKIGFQWQSAQMATAQESPSTWRKTSQGWMDLSKWNRPEPIRVERRIEMIHPLLFSGVILLVTSGFLIWSSEEFEWAQFFEKDK